MCSLFLVVGSANEYDYERFFWDLADKEGLTVQNIVDIIGTANTPTAWSATYDSVTPANNPVPRLIGAAAAEGFSVEWDTHDDFNGVHR